MKNTFIIFLLMIFTVRIGFTAGERNPAGGRSLAMGGTSVAQCDIWSLYNNQAGTAWLKGTSAGLSYENRFLLKELMYEQIGLVIPVRAGTIGLILNRFGNGQYNELKAGLSFARKFGKYFAVGAQIDYLRIHVANDYGNRNLISCEIGLLYHADRHLSFGLHLMNPVPVKITLYPPEQLPAIISIGLSYKFSEDFLTSVEAEKDLEHPVAFRTGAEYHFARQAYARVGISTAPMSFTFGFGLEFGKIKFDMASEYHQEIGFSPSGSIVYTFK